MKCKIPEISWHNRDPVLSVDFSSIFNKYYRLASGGADCHVVIWNMYIDEDGSLKQELISDLTQHQKSVNCVRWSPNGKYLASADDDGNIIIWYEKQYNNNTSSTNDELSTEKQKWVIKKILRSHKEDVYDLCWSPDSTKLLSGSIDNTAIIWNCEKMKLETIISDHNGFVQGVSWDPKNEFIATFGTDRICRLFDTNGKQIKAKLYRGLLPVPETHFLYKKEVKFFHDDTFQSFFRRLHFSPDGNLLGIPSVKVHSDNAKDVLQGTALFVVGNWSRPACILPTMKQNTITIKFCPIYFQLRESGPKPIVPLPYRMIMAVGTEHDVTLYDTQQIEPFAYLYHISYTRLTDLAWSHNGLILVASSTDGFCALVTFDLDDLGKPYIKDDNETEENSQNLNNIDKQPTKITPKKPTFLDQWTIKNNKNKTIIN